MTRPTQDARDRVVRMERKVEQLKPKIGDLDAKVTEMHQLLTQTKGAMDVDAHDRFVAAKITSIVQYALGR